MRLLFLLLLISCGDYKFVSSVNGDQPIRLAPTINFLNWAENTGRKTYFDEAVIKAPIVWNPTAKGEIQVVTLDIDKNTIDLDEKGVGPCLKNNFSAWSIPGESNIYLCPNFLFCTKNERTIYGYPGCFLTLLHELGHVLGARTHIAQNGRPEHAKGPIMCGWHSDCINPSLSDYTEEDVKFICGDGGIGGRCKGTK